MSELVKSYSVPSIEALESFTQAWHRDFPKPALFAVEGTMGAGKTTTINAICQAMGIEESSSPTFSLVNEYETKEKVKVFHFDLYRLDSIREALDIGIEEYFQDDAYVFIEWPEIIEPLFPLPYFLMKIEEENQQRVISIFKITD
jgi:tRNA threonylcarbamoyladenosine biosynthesis protein TsaE